MYFVEYHFLSYMYEYATGICDIRGLRYLYCYKVTDYRRLFCGNFRKSMNPRTHKLLSDVTTWPDVSLWVRVNKQTHMWYGTPGNTWRRSMKTKYRYCFRCIYEQYNVLRLCVDASLELACDKLWNIYEIHFEHGGCVSKRDGSNSINCFSPYHIGAIMFDLML